MKYVADVNPTRLGRNREGKNELGGGAMRALEWKKKQKNITIIHLLNLWLESNLICIIVNKKEARKHQARQQEAD